MEGTDLDNYEQSPSVAACDQDCMTTSLVLGFVSLIIVAIALASLFVAWRCNEQREITAVMQDRHTFDIIATSGNASVKLESSAGIDAV